MLVRTNFVPILWRIQLSRVLDYRVCGKICCFFSTSSKSVRNIRKITCEPIKCVLESLPGLWKYSFFQTHFKLCPPVQSSRVGSFTFMFNSWQITLFFLNYILKLYNMKQENTITHRHIVQHRKICCTVLHTHVKRPTNKTKNLCA